MNQSDQYFYVLTYKTPGKVFSWSKLETSCLKEIKKKFQKKILLFFKSTNDKLNIREMIFFKVQRKFAPRKQHEKLNIILNIQRLKTKFSLAFFSI